MRRAFTKSFLLVLAILVIVEIAMRAFWSRGLSGRFDYGYHPTAGFVEKSGGALDLVRAGGRRFHPQHFAQQKPAGTFRIMVVGDSVPRGPSLAEAYSTRVAEFVSARGIPAEGWNLCLPGYGAHRCHVVLTQALKYQPDFVIRHVNNSNEYEDEREWRRSQDFQGWHPKNLLMKSLLVRRLHEMKTEGVFWSLLPEKIRAQQGVNDAGAKIIAMTDETQIRAWQERVRRFLKEDLDLCRKAGKPVVVSMGDVAASGGYYIACHADSIFAEPSTLTGSIGVFGMIPILDKTMKNKLGVTFDTVRTGTYSAFGSPFIDFSPAEAAMIQSRVDYIYSDFLGKVAVGRKRTKEQIDEIAQGRVWAGPKAKAIGLVDDLGGLDRALASAAKLAGIEKYRTSEFPRTQTPIEQLIDRISKKKDTDDQVKNSLIRQELGEYYPAYKAMQEFRRSKGILARLPFDISAY